MSKAAERHRTEKRFVAARATPQLWERSMRKTDTLFQSATLFFADESGVTAIEYGMIAAFLAIVILGAVTNLGGTVLTTKYQVVEQALH